MKKFLFLGVLIVVTLSLSISCEPAAYPEIQGQLRVIIDGDEEIEIEPYVGHRVWFNETYESHRLDISGLIPGYDTDRYFSLYIDLYNRTLFEEGVPTPLYNVRSLDYKLETGETYEDWIKFSHYPYQSSANENVENLEIILEMVRDSRVKGRVSFIYTIEGVPTHHEVLFDYKTEDIDATGSIIGRSYTPGGGGNNEGDGGGDGDGDNSTADCDLANYNGPEFDIQVDAQCKAAYMYDCAGDTAARDAACELYYEYGNAVWTGEGSLPDCPYCG